MGRRTSVSKQAAAKTVAFLEEGGYVLRAPDPSDARRAHLTVTDRGHSLMREGEAVFDELRTRWESLVGRERVAELQDDLLRLVGGGDPVSALLQNGVADSGSVG